MPLGGDRALQQALRRAEPPGGALSRRTFPSAPESGRPLGRTAQPAHLTAACIPPAPCACAAGRGGVWAAEPAPFFPLSFPRSRRAWFVGARAGAEPPGFAPRARERAAAGRACPRACPSVRRARAFVSERA